MNNYFFIIVKKILVNNEITLKNVYYSYPNSSRPILKDISLHIPARSTVGFIGSTGSGKTTTVDIILGLLEPQKGTLEVDDQVISKEKVRVWQRSLGYVPQTIHLADDTIACNIAFGVKPKDIDMKQIERVSKIAQINKFVSEVLPDKYKTTIGERGIRLSGGQRQRIGIARALYNNPKVLILDEATSALDNETEQAVMKEIKNISKDITIIIVTHRLNTVKDCDIIYKYDDGKIVDHGNYSELFENN
jgi:ABC-type multidrug transport system fused ATPase/permease subunit